MDLTGCMEKIGGGQGGTFNMPLFNECVGIQLQGMMAFHGGKQIGETPGALGQEGNQLFLDIIKFMVLFCKICPGHHPVFKVCGAPA